MVKGVNTATSNAQRVKVGDYGSQITIQLDNVEKDALQAVDWVRAYPVNDTVVSQYVDIPDHTVADGTLFITLPEIARGTYNIEIKDTDGRIYPAEGTLRLEMLPSTKDASEVYYVTYRELILDDVTPIITGYLSENPDGFKGEKGEPGKDGRDGIVDDGSVTTVKIADKSITNVKLADNHDYVKTLDNGTDTYSVVRTGNYMLNANGNYLNMPADSLPNRNYQLKVESISDVWLMQTLVDFTEPKNQWKRRTHKTSTAVKEVWNANYSLRNSSIGSMQLMDAFSFRNNLGAGTDINTVFKEGLYLGISTNDYTNIPSELVGKNFVLQVLPARADGAFKQQIITPVDDSSTTYKRFTITKDGNAEWQKYKTSSNDNSHPLSGRTIVTFGDSITENGNYPELLSSITNMDVVKAGFGGCRMGQHSIESTTGQLYDKQCMHSLVDYIKSGDFTELIQVTETMVRSNGDDNRPQAIALSNTDWSKVDYISIFFGTNDYGGNVPIGEDGDSTGATFKGAINKVIKTLSESQQHIKLVFVTPFYRDRFQAEGDGKNSDDFENENGHFLIEYVEAIERLAKKNHIPVINMYDNSGINRYNQVYYLADGLHPNESGYKYLADMLARQMTAIL